MDFRPYEDAYKKAIKDSKYSEQKENSPYLLSFEELGLKEAYAQKDLGIWDLPIERLVGTFTSTRKNTFSPHFYPLLEKNTEFAFKWQNLYESHVQEGIRDPLKVLLYEGKFFVIEGHKRCSVLRSSEANRVTAQVFFVMPLEQSEEKQKRDDAFLHFTKLYKAQFFFFPTAEHYKELWQCIEKIFHYDFPCFEEAQCLPEEESLDLRSLFQTFSHLLDRDFFNIDYEWLSADEMVAHKEKVCLIFLRFLKIFGFSKYKDSTEKELKILIENAKSELFEEHLSKKMTFIPPAPLEILDHQNMANYAHFLEEKLKDKAALVNSGEEQSLVYQSSSTLKHKLDQKLLPILQSSGNLSEAQDLFKENIDLIPSLQKLCTLNKTDKLRVLFLHHHFAKDCEQTQQHEKARLFLQEQFEKHLETFALEGIGLDKDLELGLLAAVSKKIHYLFITFELDQKNLEEVLLHFALEHPEICIFYLGFNHKYSALNAYQIKYYECAFLQGLATAFNVEQKTPTYLLPALTHNHLLSAKAFAMGYHLQKPLESLTLELSQQARVPFLSPDSWTLFYIQCFATLATSALSKEGREDVAHNCWWGLNEQVLNVPANPLLSKEAKLMLLIFEEKLKKHQLELFPKLFLQEFLSAESIHLDLLKHDFETFITHEIKGENL